MNLHWFDHQWTYIAHPNLKKTDKMLIEENPERAEEKRYIEEEKTNEFK